MESKKGHGQAKLGDMTWLVVGDKLTRPFRRSCPNKKVGHLCACNLVDSVKFSFLMGLTLSLSL